MEYVEICLVLLFIVSICYFFRSKNGLPTNWPIIGMLLPFLKNVDRIHDYVIEASEKSQHLNFLFKGPWFTNMVMFITLEPSNLNHILSKNFQNYPKGPKFKERVDVLGDGMVNSDFDQWKYHRGIAHAFFGHPQFRRFLVEKVEEKLESALIPVLDHASKHGLVIDLQDLFERFTFDIICTLVMGHDFGSLCLDWPHIPFSKALDDVEEVVFYRHVVPTSVWKFFRWLGVRKESKYKKAWVILDDFLYKCIAKKREELKSQELLLNQNDEGFGVDVLTLYMNNGNNDDVSDKFLRDSMMSYIIAGRDTTSAVLSWFFYLLNKNPQVLFKIREELRSHKKKIDDQVYLHAALCECLRLYPPIPFEEKTAVKADTLPSGDQINPGTQIIFHLYGMGRMKSIWGEDCYEFKPERWITKTGGIKHEPSYKFSAFNAGPRACLGKDMAFIQMKAMAITILNNYEIQPLEGHPIIPDISLILRMKHGLKVRVYKSYSS